MTDEDFHRIEAALGTKLTAAYRGMMNPYSFARNSPAALYEIPDNSSTVINLNKNLRADNPFGTRWPRNYFIFGSDGESTYYYLDTTEGDGPVYQANADTLEYHQVAENLDEWSEPRLPNIDELDHELDKSRKKKTDETEFVTLSDDLLDEAEQAERTTDAMRQARQRALQEADSIMTRAEADQATNSRDRSRQGKGKKLWWQFWK